MEVESSNQQFGFKPVDADSLEELKNSSKEVKFGSIHKSIKALLELLLSDAKEHKECIVLLANEMSDAQLWNEQVEEPVAQQLPLPKLPNMARIDYNPNAFRVHQNNKGELVNRTHAAAKQKKHACINKIEQTIKRVLAPQNSSC